MLLHHAIKYEFGGWRVWVDTLAIVHSKVRAVLKMFENLTNNIISLYTSRLHLAFVTYFRYLMKNLKCNLHTCLNSMRNIEQIILLTQN